MTLMVGGDSRRRVDLTTPAVVPLHMFTGIDSRNKTLFQRFYAKVLVGDNCWEWQGAINEHGYGRFGILLDEEWTSQLAHRVAWFLATGVWPTHHVLHSCDNPLCVRHSHHFAGTQLDNIQDCVSKGRNTGGKVYATHCKRGHPLSGTNLRICGGKRICKTCKNTWKREHRASGLYQ